MSDDLPTDLMISAQIRIAARHGIPIVVTHRGDAYSGSIYLKINLLNGTAHVLNQVRMDDERVWVHTLSDTPLEEREADKYLESQIDFDPDLWVIEIEDRQGRHWFEGRLLKST